MHGESERYFDFHVDLPYDMASAQLWLDPCMRIASYSLAVAAIALIGWALFADVPAVAPVAHDAGTT
jgi:hypothetical protein